MKNKIEIMPATMKDCDFLFKLRNNRKVRKSSLNMEKIKKEDHQIWLIKTLDDPLKKVFVAWERISDNEIKSVGTIRAEYDLIEDSILLSWIVDQRSRSKGIGKIIVSKVTEELKSEDISAKIKTNNLASIHIAKYVGMKLDYIDLGNEICHFSRKKINIK
jgi:RimJ/RimL family protein N-acetyltransferase